MSSTTITYVLERHHVDYYFSNARLYAIDVTVGDDGEVCTDAVDVTGWSKDRLLAWLGY